MKIAGKNYDNIFHSLQKRGFKDEINDSALLYGPRFVFDLINKVNLIYANMLFQNLFKYLAQPCKNSLTAFTLLHLVGMIIFSENTETQ